MDKRNERILALATGLTLAWWVTNTVLAQTTHLQSVVTLVPYTTWALVLCAAAWWRHRLWRRAEEEQRDLAAARAAGGRGRLFTEEETAEPFGAVRTRDVLERWLWPVVSMGVTVGLVGWAWWLWQHREPVGEPARGHLAAASFLAGQAFLLFLIGRFLLGLSKEERLLRAPGVALGLHALWALATAIAVVLAQELYPRADRLMAQAWTIGLGLLAVEGVLSFLWDLYRPRRRGLRRFTLESRVAGLLADPAVWARDLAGALDYQFGFKLSETWLYRFLERAVLPLVLFQLAALYLLSVFLFVGPQEAAVVERWGKPHRDLGSGFHLKWPWPFETARRFPVHEVQAVEIGFERDTRPTRRSGPPAPEVITWTVPHFQQEDQFLTPSGEGAATEAVPVNLVSFNLRVEYRVRDLRAFLYRHADPQRAVRDVAYRALTQITATRDLMEVMGPGRIGLTEALQQRLAKELEQLGLGVELICVGLAGVHPPTTIADAFQSVIGAVEEKEASILRARAEANRVLPLAEADAARVRAEAAAHAVQRTAVAAAQSERFERRLESYRRAPSVYPTRLYLAAVRDGLRPARKVIVATAPGTEVIQLNLEEKLMPDLLDFGPPPTRR
ncbi:MAG: protease modulator HflK [Verrucomicrobiae bacterium]|nr:protease modulator HflK [Verrucomicrobiae bacterium]